MKKIMKDGKEWKKDFILDKMLSTYIYETK